MSNQQIINDDCVLWMKRQKPNIIDAIVTDPPYGLEFMGAEWDTFSVRLPMEVLNARRFAHLATVERLKREDVTNKAQLTLLVYQEWTRQWALEAMRILKPGAYMLVMSGTRTVHRMTSGLEDAGFIIKDCLCWVYASGFPKSYDISKGFDKRAGSERAIIDRVRIDGKKTGEIDNWGKDIQHARSNIPSTPLAIQWNGWGTALKPAWEPIVMVQKPLEGNYCENVERWGVGGLNIDACRVATSENLAIERKGDKALDTNKQGWGFKAVSRGNEGRFPANLQVDSESDGLLTDYDRFFVIPKASPSERDRGLESIPTQKGGAVPDRDTAKLNRGAKQPIRHNYHPTVKPIRLFKQLMKLVVPPGGTVLDPFLGSGTAALAASELDLACIGIEKQKEYYDIATERLKNYKED